MAKYLVIDRCSNIKELVGNAEKIYKDLGFSAKYTLEHGLKDMLDHKKVG